MPAMAPRKKSPAQLDRDITNALAKGDLQLLVDKWRAAATFNHQQAADDPDDSGYRQGYAAASENAAKDLLALLQRK